MKKTQDNFILMDMDEFIKWIQKEKVSRDIKLIQNHHTVIPSYKDFNGSNHFQRLVAMRNYHVNTNGWSDIAQNFTTFPDGTIAVCRPLNKTPAGIKGANTRGICIEHIGNFDIGKDEMTNENHYSIVRLNALLCEKFNLKPSGNTIVYHHWYDLQTGKRTNGSGTTKTCPGSSFFGGNKLEDAEKHFFPLIEGVLKKNNPQGNTRPYGFVNAKTKLNIRSGGGVKYEILDSVPHNTKVTIYEEVDGWYRIGESGKWVSSKYIIKK